MDYYLFSPKIFRSVGFNKQPLVNLAKKILKRVFEDIFECGCDVNMNGVFKIKGSLPYDEQVVVVREIERVLASKKIGVFSRSPQVEKELKKYRYAKEAKQREYALQQADEISKPQKKEGC